MMINISSHEFWFGVGAGFLLFALDIFVLAWGAKRLIYRDQKDRSASGPILALAAKFLLLGGGLYLILMILKWPVAGVALGATLCLIAVSLVGKQKMLAK